MSRRMTFALTFAPELGFREVGARLWKKIQVDNVFGRAAELAYFFLFSIFPLLIVLTSILGRMAKGAEIQRDLLQYFRTALPWSAYDLISNTLREITNNSGGKNMSLGIAFALASASAGMVAVIEGLNTSYDVKEARTWLRRRAVAVGLTVAFAVFTISALAIFLYGNQLGRFVATHVGVKPLFETAWPFLQWPVLVAFVLLALALIYRFAPNVRVQRWRWILPGATFAFLLWLIASAGLRLYLRFLIPTTRYMDHWER